jgi:hypothetical protein
MSEEADMFSVARGLIDWLESRAADEPETVRVTIARVVGLLHSHGHTPKAGNKPRGLGYDFDEAQIMASLPSYGESIEKAARAHWEGEDEDVVDAKIRGLYRHKKAIDDAGCGGDC